MASEKHFSWFLWATIRLVLALGSTSGCTGELVDKGAPSCGLSLSACADGCRDLQSDEKNCGGCGIQCPEGFSCELGACTSPCGPGRQYCNGACVSVASDVNHCGGCGVACAAGQVCAAGQCSASCTLSLCQTPSAATACADTLTDPYHCGGCGIQCPESHDCSGAACHLVCTAPLTNCAEVCVDTTTDNANCGGCGNVCPQDTTCTDSACRCNSGGLRCGDTCVDDQTDNDNCGGCGAVCGGGTVCTAGECVCPPGQELCGDTCHDLQTDSEHCGACDSACTDNDACEAGQCIGPDGCFSDEAVDISVGDVAVYQAVRIPIVVEGQALGTGDRLADLVQGKEAMFSIAVDVGPMFSSRQISARVKLRSDDGSVLDFFDKQQLSGSSSIDDPESTFLVKIDPEAMAANVTYEISLVECGAPPAGTVQSPRFPSEGGEPLNARKLGELKVHLVPIDMGGVAPDLSEAALDVYRDYLQAMYPVSDVVLSVGDPLQPSGTSFNAILESVSQRRENDDPPDDVYYYGMVRETQTFREFCGSSCTSGLGYVNDNTFPAFNVALGLTFADETSAEIMAHEIGHNHGRRHAPCGNPSDVDGQFPSGDARTDVWGYDRRSEKFFAPDNYDVMSYCHPQWLGDYTYRALLNRVAQTNNAVSANQTGTPAAKVSWYTVIATAHGARWSHPVRGKAAPGLAMTPLTILGADGQTIANAQGYQVDIGDTGARRILIPSPAADWAAVRLDNGVTLSFTHPGRGRP